MVKSEDYTHFDGEKERKFQREHKIFKPITIRHSSRIVIKHKNSTFCFAKWINCEKRRRRRPSIGSQYGSRRVLRTAHAPRTIGVDAPKIQRRRAGKPLHTSHLWKFYQLLKCWPMHNIPGLLLYFVRSRLDPI